MTAKSDIKITAEPTLARQTLRTVALLVCACVLFVGGLSVIAVSVASRALGSGGSTTEASTDSAQAPKKPLSI